MFNLHSSDRLAAWREFRDYLETAEQPLQEVVDFWNRAPFVSKRLNPNTPDDWPNPWDLVLNSDLDDLAISLGMLYTIKLTQRFNNSKCEIHTIVSEDTSPRYFLVIDNQHVLNFNYGEVNSLDAVESFKTSLIWSKEDPL